jgi:hypothetical protein
VARGVGSASRALAEAVIDPQLMREPADVASLIRRDQRDPDPARAGTAGAPDPVDIRLAVMGRVEVDHV